MLVCTRAVLACLLTLEGRLQVCGGSGWVGMGVVGVEVRGASWTGLLLCRDARCHLPWQLLRVGLQ